ncbi:pyridoxine 5'-phosphate oxidase C-terminal domain-containing protein [Streptomyces catenulae]|uniref:Pyridoxine 5'-phosphate oxidase C-terminal domain-containing protein n=1 Tax=Streptomyces catenulae TaxID=66875 RepID=A0ABV2Z6C8_9ACTN|nr:pyridoxine 5'-phosphate oxidase C-terminal domain-containing protein [Streptomyces catenulae]
MLILKNLGPDGWRFAAHPEFRQGSRGRRHTRLAYGPGGESWTAGLLWP